MTMNRARINELRALLADESLSWGDVADLQGAFEAIPADELPEPHENAGWADMLDELEARLPSATKPLTVTFGEGTDSDTYERVLASGIPAGYVVACLTDDQELPDEFDPTIDVTVELVDAEGIHGEPMSGVEPKPGETVTHQWRNISRIHIY
jgi:hypothetical protein